MLKESGLARKGGFPVHTAREGKDIPEDMLAKMKRDKEEAKKKKNDNR